MRWNEYHPEGVRADKGVLLMTKLKNQLLAIDPTLTVALKNDRVNGKAQGCYGFVTSAAGKVVYVHTSSDHVYCRTAKSTKDFTGGRNQSSDNASIAQDVVDLLRAQAG